MIVTNALYIFGTFVALNFYLFFLMGWDKSCAKTHRRRVPEKKLLTLAALGAWPGMWLGQKYWRHKTKKRSFNLTMWGIFALEVCVAAYLLTAHFN